MIKFLKVLLLSLLAPLGALAQNGTTTVTAIVKDPTGAIYVSSQVGASFFDPGTPGKLPLLNGSTFQQSYTGYATDSFGFFTLTLPDNGVIDTSSGTVNTQWNFTICYKDRQTCFTYKTPINCASNIPVTCSSNTMDLSTPLQAVAALIPSGPGGGSPSQGALYTVQASNGAGQFQVTHIISNTNTNVTTINDSLNLPIGGTLNGTFAGSPLFSVTGNEALKPSLSSPVQYVSLSGNNTYDGLSWGTAKLTVYAALQALPSGNSTTAGTGTVYISSPVNYGGPVSGGGMWIMGSPDPNYGSPPTGWLKLSGPIVIEGALRNNDVAHGHDVQSTLNSGGTDYNHPAVWISGVNKSISFKNVGLSGATGTYIKYGIDSNNVRTGSGGSSGFSLNNVGWNHGSCHLGGGPGMDIGSNSFWIWLKDIQVSGCVKQIFSIVGATGLSRTSNVTTVTTTATHNIQTGDFVTITNPADATFSGSFPVVSTPTGTTFTYSNFGPNVVSGSGQVITAGAAAINLDTGGAGSGSGLTFIENANFNNGGVRIYSGVNGSGLYLKHASYEGDGSDPDMPVVLITQTTAASIFHIEDVETSDNNVPQPGVMIHNTIAADIVTVEKVQNGVSGPALVIGGFTGSITPIRAGQYGLSGGRLWSTGIDVARRNFGPSLVAGTNLASTASTTWPFTVGAGTITSTTAPDNTNNAGRVTSSAGNSFISFYQCNSCTLTVGDSYVFGVWARSVSGNGFVNSAPPVRFSINNNGFGVGDSCTNGTAGATPLAGNPNFGFDSMWTWFSGVCTIGSTPTSAGIVLSGAVSSTISVDFYSPTLLKFPVGSKSLNEIYEIANNFSSFPDNIAISGAVGMLRGQTFVMGTGANFLYTMAGTPTVDRTITWQDASGTPALKDVVETFTAKQTFANISLTFGDFPVQASPGNPSAGNIRIYGDSGSGNLTCLTSAGASCLPAGGAGTPGGSSGQVQVNVAGAFGGSVNLTYTSPALSIGSTAGATGQLKLVGLTSGTVTLQSQDIAGTWTFKLPINAGTANFPLITDGSGNSSWTLLPVAGGGSGAGTFTTNQLLFGNGTGAFQSLVGSLAGTNPVITFTAGSASAVPLAVNTTSSPTGDAFQVLLNSVKASWFDSLGFLHTPQTTYTGIGPLTLSGTEGTCGSVLSGADIICLGDSATHDAQLSVNGGPFKPMVQSSTGNPTAFGVTGWSNTFPQLVASGAGTSGQAFLSAGAAAFGNYGALNLAGGATIFTGILPPANGGTGAASLAAANIMIGSGSFVLGDCLKSGGSNLVVDQGTACGGGGGSPPLNTVVAATGSSTINNTVFTERFNYALTGSMTGFIFGEQTAATGSNNIILQATTNASSTAVPFQADNNGNGVQLTSTGGLVPIGTGTNTANKLNNVTTVNGITTAGIGVPFILGTVSNVTAQSTSQGAVTLATSPAAAPYAIVYYASQNAVCTTGANTVSFTFNWTDAGNARVLNTGNLTLGTAQATSGYLSGSIPIFNNSGNVTYTSTVSGTCASGTSSYDIHASIVRVQ